METPKGLAEQFEVDAGVNSLENFVSILNRVLDIDQSELVEFFYPGIHIEARRFPAIYRLMTINMSVETSDDESCVLSFEVTYPGHTIPVHTRSISVNPDRSYILDAGLTTPFSS